MLNGSGVNNMKHTKGKWKVKKTLGYSVKVGDKYIAGIHGQEKKVKDDSKALGYRYDNSETVANANLIASAPEMKKALEMVRDAWKNNEINFECDDKNGTGYWGTHHLIKNTLNALAKAEGNE